MTQAAPDISTASRTPRDPRREPDQAARLRMLVQSLAADPAPARPLAAVPAPAAASRFAPSATPSPTPNPTLAPSPAPAPPLAPSSSSPPVRRARWLVVASGKGGVGKTNIAVNLSIALTRLGHRVTLLDADMGVANADVVCGLTPSARLDSVIDGGRATLASIAVTAPGGFRLVPGTVGLARMASLDEAQRDRLVDSIATLEADSDVLVVDASPGIGPLVARLIAAADLSLIVTTPEPTSITDAYALIKCARLGECAGGEPAKLQLVVNNAADAIQAQAAITRLQSVSLRFLNRPLECLGWIAQDPHVSAAVHARQPLLLRSPRAPAARAIEQLARGLAGPLGLSAHSAAQPLSSRPVVAISPQPSPGTARAGWLSRVIGRARV